MFELLKQHSRLWLFLWKYNCLEFALQIHAKVVSGNLSKILCRCTTSRVFVMLKWGESCSRLLIYY